MKVIKHAVQKSDAHRKSKKDNHTLLSGFGHALELKVQGFP